VTKLKLAAVFTAPAHYQASIFKQLNVELGESFLAIFQSAGQVKAQWNEAWQATIVNTTGLLENYQHHILEQSSSSQEALGTLLSDFGPSAVLINSHKAPICSWAEHWAHQHNARVLLRSSPTHLALEPLLRRTLRTLYLKKRYRTIDAFCAIGTHAHEHYSSISARPQDVYMSPYCLDEFFLQPLAARREQLRSAFREKHGIKNETVLLICGRLDPRKRIDWSLQESIKLAQERAIRLIVLGDGPQRQLVLEAANAHPKLITWLGFQQRQGVAEALAGSDVLLLPSIHEPWGAIVNEALLFRVPVVASSGVSAAADLVLDGQTGFNFPRNDRAQFRQAIVRSCDLIQAGLQDEAFDSLSRRFSVAAAAAGVVEAASAYKQAPPHV
jgi:glycosyltransferase involved in cell wall biosynthesis